MRCLHFGRHKGFEIRSLWPDPLDVRDGLGRHMGN